MKGLLVAACFAVLAFPSTAVAGRNTWTPVTATGQAVRDIAFLPGQAGGVLVSTNGGIYRSADGGATWPSSGNGFADTTSVGALAVDPLDPTEVWAVAKVSMGTVSRTWLSATSAASWAEVHNGMASEPTSVAVAPDGTAYAARFTLWQLGPSASTWSDTGLTTNIWAIAVDPLSSIPYALTEQGGAAHVQRRTVGMWQDGGALAGNPFPSALTFGPDGSSWVGTSGSTFKGSVVNPLTPAALPSAPTGVQDIAVDPGDAQHAWVAGGAGVSVTTDGGATWRDTQLGGAAQEIALVPGLHPVVYAGTTNGVFRYEVTPPDPSAVSVGAVGTTGASLAGSVNPLSLPGTAYFQYGPTTAYGSTTPVQSIASGSTAVPLSATLTGLTPGTTYHVRLVSTTAAGTSLGGDAGFTTLPGAAVTSASLRASWLSGRGTGTLEVVGTIPIGGVVRLRLMRSGSSKLLVNASRTLPHGQFTMRLALPASVRPGLHRIELDTPAGSVARQVALAAPTAGVVDTQAASARRGGKAARKLSGKSGRIWVRFRFAAAPRRPVVTATWTGPRRARVRVSAKVTKKIADIPLRKPGRIARGTWRCTLRSGGAVIAVLSVRVT
jgi:hypothetical protein